MGKQAKNGGLWRKTRPRRSRACCGCPAEAQRRRRRHDRGKKADAALAELTFSRRRIAQDVKKTLESAIANAENNHDLDINTLVVSEAYVGKNLVMKRWTPRAGAGPDGSRSRSASSPSS
jgi:ribosomal protein L22